MRKAVVCGILLFVGLLVGKARADDALNKQLLAAVNAGDKAKVEALIAEGADVNATNTGGDTPLIIACNSQPISVGIVQLLIARHSNVNAKNQFGVTALHYAAAYYNSEEALKLLIAAGANVNARDNHGKTPLFWASSMGPTELLVANGADVNAKDDNGYARIHYADSFLAEILVSKGARIKDIYVQNRKKIADCSFLAGYAQNGNTKSLETQLAYYDVDLNCKDGILLDNAIIFGRANIIAELFSNGAVPVSPTFDFAALAKQYETFNPEGRSVAALVQEAITKQRLTAGNGSQRTIQQLVDDFHASSDSEAIRTAIINLALKQHSAIPSEAEAAAGRGAYIFKNASSTDDKLSAAKEYLTAIEFAPWVANYYFNLCTVLEKTPYTQQALHACKLYLVAAPNAADADEMNQRIAGLQYAADRDKAKMKQRTVYIKSRGIDDLYRFGGITGTVSGREIAMKLFVDWTASPPKYQVYVGRLQGTAVHGTPHDLVTIDSWTGFCNPEVNMHLIIQPEGEGFVALSSGNDSLRATLDDLFKAKQQTMAQAVMFSAGGDQGDRFYIVYEQGGLDEKRAGYAFYESDCNGTMLKKDPRALPDDFVSLETVRDSKSYGRFHPEVAAFGIGDDTRPKTDMCTTQFANKTGYHFGEQE